MDTSILNKIKVLQDQLIALEPLKPEYQQKLEKKFRLEFNYNSNHIEGNTLTYGETELYLIFGKTKGEHDDREYKEMEAGDVALKIVKELAQNKETPLTEAFIRELNKTILVKPYWKEAITQDGQSTRRLISIGEYKKYPNSVQLQNGEIFEYASPTETPALMSDLIQWYRTEAEKKELPPVALAALLHYKFVRIHPFDDGNGRISRLLMNYVLYYHDLPPVIIKSADKKNYLNALNNADTGDIDAFVNYVAEQLVWSLEISLKAGKGEIIDELGDLDKKISILKKKLNKPVTVKLEKNKDVIIKFYSESIVPVLDFITSKLNEFDVFFRSRKVVLEFYAHNGSGTSDSPLSGISCLNTLNEVNNITYVYYLENLITKSNFNVRTVVTIIFHQLTCEINVLDGLLNIDKLYEESYTNIDLSNIAELLGNNVLEKIQPYLK